MLFVGTVAGFLGFVFAFMTGAIKALDDCSGRIHRYKQDLNGKNFASG